MSDIVDPVEHAELIRLQQEVLSAFGALDHHAAVIAADGRGGIEWTEQENTRAQELREAARQATAEKETALHASGLVDQHGYYPAAQALKTAAKAARSDGQTAPAHSAPSRSAAGHGELCRRRTRTAVSPRMPGSSSHAAASCRSPVAGIGARCGPAPFSTPGYRYSSG